MKTSRMMMTTDDPPQLITAPQESSSTPDKAVGVSGQVTYEPLQVLGRGSFGVVMMARVHETGKIVAVKKVLFDGRLHHRELVLLRDHLGLNAHGDRHSVPSRHGNTSHQEKGDISEDSVGASCSHSDEGVTTQSKREVDTFTGVTSTIVSYHPCIVRLLDHFSACGLNGEQHLFIVMDYLPIDVHRLHQMFVRQKQQRMPLILVKVIMFQLARALVFLHRRGICHRDVKPSNLLVDPETGVVKLCDFGSAKVMQPPGANGEKEKNVSYICSRYYRAPELLLGSLYYEFHVDMWAFGCVLAELLCGEVLFRGSTTVDQMTEIFKVLGAPSSQELFALNPQSADALLHTSETCRRPQPSLNTLNAPKNDYLQRYHALRIKSLQWQSVLPPETPPAAVSLVGQLLRYTPAERLSAAEVLESSFFDELFLDDVHLPNGAPLSCSMFQVTMEEYGMLPSWLLERMSVAERLALQREGANDGEKQKQEE